MLSYSIILVQPEISKYWRNRKHRKQQENGRQNNRKTSKIMTLRINFEQQNQMFDKQAEWNSAKSQKERLQEAGLNPALMYGIGGEGG